MEQLPKASGCYIVQNAPNSIKIGMGKDLSKRIKQYQGYQANAEPIKVLCWMVIPQSEYKKLEKNLHFCAEFMGLQIPQDKFEHFSGDQELINKFINQIKQYCDNKQYICQIKDQTTIKCEYKIIIKDVIWFKQFKYRNWLVLEIQNGNNYIIDLKKNNLISKLTNKLVICESDKQNFGVLYKDQRLTLQIGDSTSDQFKTVICGFDFEKYLQQQRLKSDTLQKQIKYEQIMFNGNQLTKDCQQNKVISDENIKIEGYIDINDTYPYIYAIINQAGSQHLALIMLSQ